MRLRDCYHVYLLPPTCIKTRLSSKLQLFAYTLATANCFVDALKVEALESKCLCSLLEDVQAHFHNPIICSRFTPFSKHTTLITLQSYLLLKLSITQQPSLISQPTYPQPTSKHTIDRVRASGCQQEPLPPTPLSGMLNRTGGKVRLTFKLECDQLWIGTKERTEKVAMSSVKAVVSEPIAGHEEYHIMVRPHRNRSRAQW